MTSHNESLKPFLFATLARNVLVLLMCACVAWVGVALLGRVVPDDSGIYAALIAVIAVAAAGDVLYVRQRNARVSLFSKEWFLLNASRWTVIILTLKLVSYLGRDLGAMLSELPNWRINPLLFFWDERFALSLGIVLAVWAVGRTLGGDLAQLTEGEQVMLTDPETGARTDRLQTRHALATHIFVIGALMAVAGSLANHELQTGAPAFPAGIDLVLYFALGLALLGLSQLTVLRANWLWERTPISANLITRWTVLGLLFIGGLAVLAIILPSGLVRGALPTIAEMLATLAAAAQALSYLIFGLLSLLLWPFAQLFNLFGSTAAPVSPQAPPPPPIAPPVGEGLVLPPWFQLAQAIVFWTILIILLGYATRYFLRQHEGLRKALSELPLIVWLRAGWRGLRKLVHSIRQETLSLRLAAAKSKADVVATVDTTDLVPDLAHLPRREQLRLIYLDLLERASRQGIARREGQTPYEFADTLSQAIPTARPDINDLTQAFVDARYSRREVVEERVGWARQVAVRIGRLIATTHSAQ